MSKSTSARLIALTSLFVSTQVFAQSTQRVLPTVNKIDLETGVPSTLNLYQGLSSVPLGITVAAGDVDGDGRGDFTSFETWTDPHETMDGIVVRDWNGTIKGITPPPSPDYYPSGIAVGHVPNQPAYSSFVAVADRARRFHTWTWTDTGFDQVQTMQAFDSDFDDAMSIAIDSSATDEYAFLVAGQNTVTGHGHVTVLKRGDNVPKHVFDVTENTHGAGIQVASGDVDGVVGSTGEPRNEIITLSLTLPGVSGVSYALSVFNDDGSQSATRFFPHTAPIKSHDKDGYMTGRLATGDVDGDGLSEIIVTSAGWDGPICDYYDVTEGADGQLHISDAQSITLGGIEHHDDWNPQTILAPSWSSLSFESSDTLAAAVSGTLLLSTSVVPEPTTLTLVGAVSALMLRRKR